MSAAPRLYHQEHGIELWLGDCRQFDPPAADLVMADPPYGETSIDWDRWPEGWPAQMPGRSLWCFGSMRMFFERMAEFASWKFGQDLVWEKQNGSGFHADRFKRVHEHATHWYRGEWEDLYKCPVTVNDATARQIRRKRRPTHMGRIDAGVYESIDGGPRLMRSVIYERNCHGYADHPTQKPIAVLRPLIEYACPPGGLVYVPFAGVGSELLAAKQTGRRVIGIEARELYCESAARRLAQGVFEFDGGGGVMADLTRSEIRRRSVAAIAAIMRARAAVGRCRHCGGALPCWSAFGDASPGRRYPIPSGRRRFPIGEADRRRAQ